MTDYTDSFDLDEDYEPCYTERQPLFSDKEIIIRSGGKAMVIRISSAFQIFVLLFFFAVMVWCAYSYHMYHKSGRILLNKDQELVQARDAYVDLMGDFVAIQKNIDEVLNSSKSKDVERYKRQALLVEDKIKQLTADKDWADNKTIADKASFNEVALQRDLAAAERDALRDQLKEMETAVQNIKKAEMEVFKKVESIASKEISKIKSAIAKANSSLKQQGLYYNPLANSKKKDSKGGTFIPVSAIDLQDKAIIEKISNIYQAVDDLEYYRETVKSVPLGKPVWSYWVSSKFGVRNDPFNRRATGHKGVDLAARSGNKIKVMARGKVTQVKHSNTGYGNLVVVDHGNGFVTKYAHMSKIYVTKGDQLDINDAVGEVGSTGRSTGPHLHYEILYQGRPVDPMPFMQAKIS